MDRNAELFARAERLIPGGVNSPVRAFRSVGGTPVFAARAKGQYLWDENGKRYTDYIGSWGPMILGHAYEPVVEAVKKAAELGTSYGLPTEAEVEMAELVCSLVPGVEMVRMVSSGTEAVLSALRVARGFTGRELIVKFEGCYHGHSDSMLVKAGSGLATAGQPDSAGVTRGTAETTLTCAYNDADELERIFAEHGERIAAVIVEPVAANMGVVLPEDGYDPMPECGEWEEHTHCGRMIPGKKGFLERVREITTRYGALLIFDEVITGFRLGINCASGYFGVTPDLSTFGKIIGGGLPVGAYGGRRDVMSCVAPIGPVYQAGTLSGNPIAMAAGLTAPEYIQRPQLPSRLARRGARCYVRREGRPRLRAGHRVALDGILHGKAGILLRGREAQRHGALREILQRNAQPRRAHGAVAVRGDVPQRGAHERRRGTVPRRGEGDDRDGRLLMRKGEVQIYTGDGKGKSTAAFGLCLRALGHGHRVRVVQFLKAERCGEHVMAEKIGLEVSQCPMGRKSGPCARPCPLFIEAQKILEENAADLLVLDELMAAIRHGCVTLDEALSLLDKRPENTEIVMTGRRAPRELAERAALVTSMEKVKHFFDAGVPAREGIEY